jgi:hypothetical protein
MACQKFRQLVGSLNGSSEALTARQKLKWPVRSSDSPSEAWMARQKVRHPALSGQKARAPSAQGIALGLGLLPVLHEDRPFMLSDAEEPHKSQRRTEREPQDEKCVEGKSGPVRPG